ncbi:MAG: hypothetical protein AAFR93_09355 [Pseudomonadota bacterium]
MSSFSTMDWVAIAGVVIAALGLLVAVFQYFKRGDSGQRATNGGVNVGGDNSGNISTQGSDDPKA